MILLDRLKGNSLLVSGFEDIISEWMAEPTSPIPERAIAPTDFNIQSEVPADLKTYWAICQRWPQLPLAGNLDKTLARKYETEEKFIKSERNNKQFTRLDKSESDYPNNPNHYLIYSAFNI